MADEIKFTALVISRSGRIRAIRVGFFSVDFITDPRQEKAITKNERLIIASPAVVTDFVKDKLCREITSG